MPEFKRIGLPAEGPKGSGVLWRGTLYASGEDSSTQVLFARELPSLLARLVPSNARKIERNHFFPVYDRGRLTLYNKVHVYTRSSGLGLDERRH